MGEEGQHLSFTSTVLAGLTGTAPDVETAAVESGLAGGLGPLRRGTVVESNGTRVRVTQTPEITHGVRPYPLRSIEGVSQV